MTAEEAKIFFPHTEDDDLQDLYDERFFEYKNFFLSKIPIKKVVDAKINRLLQMENAFRFLQNEEVVSIIIPTTHPTAIEFSDNVLQAFNQWEQQKGMCKQRIVAATTVETLVEAVNYYVQVTQNYWQKWVIAPDLEVEVEQLSKEEDPMQLYAAIQQFNVDGGERFEDILTVNNNLFLLKEMKRLSLLAKNYGSGSI